MRGLSPPQIPGWWLCCASVSPISRQGLAQLGFRELQVMDKGGKPSVPRFLLPARNTRMFGGSPDSAQSPCEPAGEEGSTSDNHPAQPELPELCQARLCHHHRAQSTRGSPFPAGFPLSLSFPCFSKSVPRQDSALLACLCALLPPAPPGDAHPHVVAVPEPAGNYSRCKVGGRRGEATFAALSAVVRFSPFDIFFFPSSLSSAANVLCPGSRSCLLLALTPGLEALAAALWGVKCSLLSHAHRGVPPLGNALFPLCHFHVSPFLLVLSLSQCPHVPPNHHGTNQTHPSSPLRPGV